MRSALAHVMVVGGTRRDWQMLGAPAWQRLIDELGTAAADGGAPWLTIRAYEAGDDTGLVSVDERRVISVAGGRCTVIVDPVCDGRELFAAAMARLPADVDVDDKTVTEVLYEPADVEPDLVIVLGPSTRLPPSLVWELAYGELVFLPVALDRVGGAEITGAIDEYGGRRRRFGGLDP
ncbi:MAG: undecaprenyl diphosphate synthase family protein [Desertimonas sp.]